MLRKVEMRVPILGNAKTHKYKGIYTKSKIHKYWSWGGEVGGIRMVAIINLGKCSRSWFHIGAGHFHTISTYYNAAAIQYISTVYFHYTFPLVLQITIRYVTQSISCHLIYFYQHIKLYKSARWNFKSTTKIHRNTICV